MAEEFSWFEMAEQFEKVDPWGSLELSWLFNKTTGQYLYSVRFASVSSYADPSDPRRTQPIVIGEKFEALCARASRKRGLVPCTMQSWFAQLSIGKRTASFDGTIPHPTTKEPMEVMTGTIPNIAQKSAALCYQIDASPETHSAPVAVVPVSAIRDTNANRIFPNRAIWMAARLRERSWDKNSLWPRGGPDRKTVQKILDGKYIRVEVLKRVVDALNHERINGVSLAVTDIPSD